MAGASSVPLKFSLIYMVQNVKKEIKNLEVVSKPRIRSESKAQPDEKAQHTCKYVGILKRAATQLSGLG